MTEPNCLNCGAPLTGKYCAACGQEHQNLHRPFWALVADYIDSNFAADSRLWRTLGLMIAAPGAVARRHLDGKRTSYVTPIKFYVFVTIAFFIVLGLSDVTLMRLMPSVTVLSGEAAQNVPEDQRTIVAFHFSFLELAPTAIPVDPNLSENLRREIRRAAETEADVNRILSMIDMMAEFADHPERSNDLLATWIPRLLVILVPLFAMWLWLLYATKRVLMYDHLVFSLYFHAFLFMVLTAFVLIVQFTGRWLPNGIMGWLFAVSFLVHLVVAMKRVYGGSALALSWRALLAVLGYFIVFLIAVRLLFMEAGG
ncbi:MAG: DUF3667 domain-containing protein [Rhodobacteraceae bacterium]|nr:DUF3667 domain-containing protein [Paracoccaceae bacterium]